MIWTASTSPVVDCEAGLFLDPPPWIAQFLVGAKHRPSRPLDGAFVDVQTNADFCLVRVCAPGARRLSSEEFEDRTAEIYAAIEHEMRTSPGPSPVRFWNHLPEIHAPAENDTDRYMSFNAGRFRAYSQWLGSGTFDRTVPTASAVGHLGQDLVVHALGSRMKGIAVANPRQVNPHRYSRRFGPLPPCFARATVLPAYDGISRKILVGGTASIRGEESTHVGDVRQQTIETFDNLAYLVRAAVGAGNSIDGMTTEDEKSWLRHFRHLRVYYVRESDRNLIEKMAAEAFTEDCQIQYLRADLCRAELLVEIEGLAEG